MVEVLWVSQFSLHLRVSIEFRVFKGLCVTIPHSSHCQVSHEISLSVVIHVTWLGNDLDLGGVRLLKLLSYTMPRKVLRPWVQSQMLPRLSVLRMLPLILSSQVFFGFVIEVCRFFST